MSLTTINIYTLKQVRTKRRLYDLEGCQISCPLACYKAIQHILDLNSEPVEKFGIIALNTKYEINGIHIICSGTVDHVPIEPRQCLLISFNKMQLNDISAAMLNNASAIIAFHNHPTGDPSPSPGDILMSQRLKNAGELLGIELLDHVITGRGNYTSLREMGKI